MVQALLDSEFGDVLVFEAVEGEAEGGVSGEDVVEELATLLDLEVVGSVEGSLVDGAPLFGLGYETVTSLGLPSPLLTKTSSAITS